MAHRSFDARRPQAGGLREERELRTLAGSAQCSLVGPAMWFFNINTGVSTSLSAEDEELLFDTLNDAIKEKFPNSNIAFDGSGYSKKGSFRTNTFGYRYMFNLGFRF